MAAKELWLKRKDVMDFEDKQLDVKSQIDDYKNYVLNNDVLLMELIEEHNEMAAIFDKEMEELSVQLQDKMDGLKKRKLEIQTHSRYIMLNDNILAELSTDYNNVKNEWKSAITKYTIGLDEFVQSGEVKDV